MGNKARQITKAKARTLQRVTNASTSIVFEPQDSSRNLTSVAMTDFGDIGYLAINPKGTAENYAVVSFTGWSVSGTQITITGVTFLELEGTGTSAASYDFPAGTDVIITDNHHWLNNFVDLGSAQTIDGVKTFTDYPQIADPNTPPTQDAEFATKKYADDLAFAGANLNKIVVDAVAGETVAENDIVYFDETDEEWKLASATFVNQADYLVGLAMGAGTNGNAIDGGVMIQGIKTGFSGLDSGEPYFMSDTAGDISLVAGTVFFELGYAQSATQLYFFPKFKSYITKNQKDALQGTEGTPSNTNRYVTDDDTATTSTADAVVRGNGSGKIDDGWLTGNAVHFANLPLYEDIDKGELVRIINDSGTTKLTKVLGYPSTNQTKTVTGVNPGSFFVDIFEDTVIVVYQSDSNTDLRGVVGIINSDNTVTWGTVSVLASGTYSGLSVKVTLVSGSYAILTYNQAGDGDPDIRGLGISGTTISVGSQQNLITTGSFSVSSVTRTSNTRAIVRYDDGVTYHYRIVNMSSTNTATLGTQQTDVSATDFLLSENRIIRARTSDFNVYTVGADSIVLVASNSGVGTGGRRWVSYGDNTGVLGYTDGTDYYLAFISESAGTLTVTKNTIVIASDTAVNFLTSGIEQEIIIGDTTSQLLITQESTLFDVKNTYTGVTSFTPDIASISGSNKLLVLDASSPITFKFAYPDYLETVGYINEDGLANDNRYIIPQGQYTGVTGLTAVGANYYVQADATISQTATDKYIGKSLSSTSLLLDVEIE